MKKLILSIALMGLIVWGCSKDEANSPTVGLPTSEPDITIPTPESLAGTEWNYHKNSPWWYNVDPDGQWIFLTDTSGVIIESQDGFRNYFTYSYDKPNININLTHGELDGIHYEIWGTIAIIGSINHNLATIKNYLSVGGWEEYLLVREK